MTPRYVVEERGIQWAIIDTVTQVHIETLQERNRRDYELAPGVFEAVATPEETDFFALAKIGWIEPMQRDGGQSIPQKGK